MPRGAPDTHHAGGDKYIYPPKLMEFMEFIRKSLICMWNLIWNLIAKWIKFHTLYSAGVPSAPSTVGVGGGVGGIV